MFTFFFVTITTMGGRVTERRREINSKILCSESPFVLALHLMADDSKLAPIQYSRFQELRGALRRLEAIVLEDISVPISRYSRESFTDLLYLIEQIIQSGDSGDYANREAWRRINNLLKRNNQPLGDGTQISSCINDFVSIFRNRPTRVSQRSQLSAIPHSDLKELETKAITITKDLIDGISKGCEADINEYLKLCKKQERYAKYKLAKTTEAGLQKLFTKPCRKAPFRQTDLLKFTFAFLKHRDTYIFNQWGTREFFLPLIASLPILKRFTHHRSGSSLQPWFFCQYRLPNYLLTSFFMMLLARTGWNIASVGCLSTDNVKKLSNGGFEIQAPKHKTQDETPKIIVSKADQYFKTVLHLLLWNNAQLKKFNLLSSADNNLWYGWQASYDRPLYPLELKQTRWFFERHGLPVITPSSIRPIKSSFSFLKHGDIEMVRVLLGHSNLDTTNLYLKNNLISQLNESRILEFQKRFETTVAYHTSSDCEFNNRGFSAEKIHSTLLGEKDAGDEKQENRYLNEARDFLRSVGVETINSSIFITSETVEKVLRLKNYYRNRWREIMERNPLRFSQYHINIILYITVFLRITRERKPLLLDQLTDILKADIGEKNE